MLSSWQSHCESSPGSFDECRTAPSGHRPKTKPDDLGCESACTGCQSIHPPLPFIIITQPESWYSFYRPMEGRRLSRPGWLVTYRDGLPVHRRSPILVLTRSDNVLIKLTKTGSEAKSWWYSIVGFNIPPDTLSVILGTMLRVRWPNRQCHSTEGLWLVNPVKVQSHQAQLTTR